MTLLRGSIGVRLYVVGVVQLVLVALTAVLVGYVVARVPERADVRAVAVRLKPLLSDEARLSSALSDIRKQQNLMLSVYDEANRLVATNVEPPLPLPRWGREVRAAPPPGPPPPGFPPPFGPPPHGRHPGPPPDMFTRLEFSSGDGTLVARPPHHRPSPIPPLVTLFSGLVVVGVGAYLASRWISRPLARLSGAIQSFGRGDLTVRTGLTRADEIGQVGRVFDEMAERMGALLLAEKELLANVSHELRTPLARIRVALEIAAEGDAAATRASLAEIAVDLAELESLIDDVLATTRLAVASKTAAPAGFAIHREELAPRAICERAAERFRARHPERPFDVDIEDELPVVAADPTLLRRVLDNLLENAAKYSPGPTEEVVLRALRSDEGVVFEVEDHGVGIDEEDLPRVFEPFFRGERSRSRGAGGVGLGLTLVKRIVEAHDGTIVLKSAKGAGTTVRVTIPAGSR